MNPSSTPTAGPSLKTAAASLCAVRAVPTQLFGRRVAAVVDGLARGMNLSVVVTVSKQSRRRREVLSVSILSYAEPPIAPDVSAISHVTA
jgi:hypothetical protein